MTENKSHQIDAKAQKGDIQNKSQKTEDIRLSNI